MTTSTDLQLMRESGAILSKTLSFIGDTYIRPGVSPLDISLIVRDFIRSHDGAEPAFLGYNGFPNSACFSVNNQVVHGIPSRTPLCEGDIISIDCGVVREGHFSDACRTFGVGEILPLTSRLLEVTDNALSAGISKAIVGNRVSDISYAIQRHVEQNGFNVSLEFVGHGIGRVLHGPPCVPNYGPPGKGDLLTQIGRAHV